MLENYLPIGIMIVAGILFGVVMSKASEFLGPKKPTDEKLSTYESGMEPVRSARERFSVKFYLIAMLFILFDIEAIFLYPWAVVYRQLKMFAFVEMLIFVILIMSGFFFIWKKGVLDWAGAAEEGAEK